MGTRPRRIASAAVVLAISATLTAPVAAQPDRESRGVNSGGSDRISVSGTCDAGSRWSLSGRSRFLRIDVEGRVEGVRARKRARWVLRLAQNQNTVAVTTRRSSGGGLKVKARVNNQPGTDTFTLTAQNRSTGEICQGNLTF